MSEAITTRQQQALTPELELFQSRTREPFARVKSNGHWENWPLHSRGFRDCFEDALYKTIRPVPSERRVKEILRQLAVKARHEGPQWQTALRCAEHGENIYLDLCDDAWRVIEITPQGWRLTTDPPVRFYRTPHMRALPAPTPGGSTNDIWQFIRAPRDQRLLLLSWLMAAYRATGPHPILALQGPQGAAKSTAATVICQLTDPREALSAPPRGERDLFIAAQHSHVLAYDNLSKINDNLSDALCRLVTGAAFKTRKLYTDREQVALSAQRPILINGIEDLGERGDLLDRMLTVRLTLIDEHERRPERELWEDFAVAQPRILGALLDAASAALRRLPARKTTTYSRMADFEQWATACEVPLGYRDGDFKRAHDRHRKEAKLTALEASPVAAEIVKLINTREFEGTYQRFLTELNAAASDDARRDPRWPRSPRALRAATDRAEADLTVAGIEITRLQREGGTGRRLIRFSRTQRDDVKM